MSARPILHVLNGPNLNLLGRREPDIYGRFTLDDIERLCRTEADAAGLELIFRQTNAEHELVGWIHEALLGGAAGIVINPAAFTHGSHAIHDALKACACPIAEVHISNIYARVEPWRARSVTAAAATGIIAGLGAHGYELAIRAIAARLRAAPRLSEAAE